MPEEVTPQCVRGYHLGFAFRTISVRYRESRLIGSALKT